MKDPLKSKVNRQVIIWGLVILMVVLGIIMVLLPAYRAPPPWLGGGTWSSHSMSIDPINPLCGPTPLPPCWAM